MFIRGNGRLLSWWRIFVTIVKRFNVHHACGKLNLKWKRWTHQLCSCFIHLNRITRLLQVREEKKNIHLDTIFLFSHRNSPSIEYTLGSINHTGVPFLNVMFHFPLVNFFNNFHQSIVKDKTAIFNSIYLLTAIWITTT